MSFEFVVEVPAQLAEGMLYVSTTYATAIHLCACGCGQEVVTPLAPARWRLTFDGESVSLYPSIGNWGLPCHSHYWIERNVVHWERGWTPREVAEARESDDRDLRASNQRRGAGRRNDSRHGGGHRGEP